MGKLIVIFSRLYEIALAFLLLKIASDYLSPDEYARLNLFLAITQGIALFLISPIQNWILVNNKQAIDGKWLSHILIFEFAYAIIVSVIAFTVLYAINFSMITTNLFFVCIFIVSIVSPIIIQTLVPIFNLVNISSVFVALSVMNATLGFSMPILLVLSFEKNYEYWLLGMFSAQIIVSVFALRFMIKKKIFSFNGDVLSLKKLPFKKILNFSLPLSFAVAFQWFNAQGFRLQLEDNITLYALGSFIMGFSFGGKFLNAIEKVFSTVFMPGLYNRQKNVTIKRAWLQYFYKMTILYIVSSLALYLFATQLYKLLIAEEYQSGLQYIAAGMLFDMFRCILNSIYQYNMLTSRNNLQFICNAIISLLIAIVIYFVFHYGISFNIFVYSMPFIMASVAILCFFINLVDKNEDC